MRQARTVNPFLMMMDPQVIIDAVERSQRLNQLERHVCRPLDRPLIPRVGAGELEAYDSEIDLESDAS
jgi:hypothetical protein